MNTKEMMEDIMSEQESYRKLNNGDGSGGSGITPSAKPSKYRTDYKPKSKLRTKWEKGVYRKLTREGD